jgi:hypothetical protein
MNKGVGDMLDDARRERDEARAEVRRLRRRQLGVEFDRETDGRWIAAIPDLPGVMRYGRTKPEALAAVFTLAASVIREGGWSALSRASTKSKRKGGAK